MTQEEEKLLLKDLCARLPHYTMVLMDDGGVEPLVSVNVNTGICNGLKGLPKPYLRPMSSMTEEERKEYNKVMFQSERYEDDYAADVDWLIENHFDYRGLIPMGLAIEAPEGMYE